MKPTRQTEKNKKKQNIHLTMESMITLGISGFLIVLAILIVITPQEEPIIEIPSTIDLKLPKSLDRIVYTDSLLPKENSQKH